MTERQSPALALILLAMSAGMTHARPTAPINDKLLLVDHGVSKAPIVIFENAPPITRRTADELAEYIERVSGARPDMIEGEPSPLPEHAIWVGYQPVLTTLFPNVDFDFKQPEEILIAANGAHMVIAGRDIWDPDHLVVKGKRYTVNGMQQEYGTANAVYTFIQDFLDVRWLWPGELGIDVIKKRTIAFEPFEYRYHPPLRARKNLFVFAMPLRLSAYGHSEDWVRRQRIQLDSLRVSGGHAFKEWWDRFHDTHPDYFALQPDGTRGGGRNPYPSAKAVKICFSNPDVWKQWVDDVADQIAHNPGLTCFNAAPNDGYLLGVCTCEKCRAWDHPDADLRPCIWQGMAQRAPALSDRHVTFANHCARLLKQRYPDKDYRVSMLAYGNSRPAPMAAVPDDNVVIANAANMFWSTNILDKDTVDDKTYAREYANWGKVTKNQVWRPNTGSPAGWQAGLPDVPFERVMASYQYALDNNCIGIIVDAIWEHWATQGPLYYILAQKTWDPSRDWRAVLDEYYQRGFGPAAKDIAAYWSFLEEARNRKVDDYTGEPEGYTEVYNDAFFAKAYGMLDKAVAAVADAEETYRKRIEFIRVGLDHTRLCAEARTLSIRIINNDLKDDEGMQLLLAKWDEIQANAESVPHAVYWPTIRPGSRMISSGVFHPDQLHKSNPRRLTAWRTKAFDKATLPKVDYQAAADAGWELVFSDDFNRDELGDNWKVVAGKWEVKDGALVGGGTLVSARSFPDDGAPAYLRLEYEGAAELTQGRISDFSALLHVNDAESEKEALSTGYFFQFGGRWNKNNKIARGEEVLAFEADSQTRVARRTNQRVVAENNAGQLSLFVNGACALTAKESESLIGKDHNRVGFFFYTPARVTNVRVYTKRLSEGLDLE